MGFAVCLKGQISAKAENIGLRVVLHADLCDTE